jgi:hypothetical protein
MLFTAPPSRVENSSIDRFFWSTGTKFLGRYGSPGALPLFIAGGSHCAVFLVLLTVFITTKRVPAFMPWIFFAIAATLLGAGYVYSRWLRSSLSPEVRLSSQAQKLLYKIGSHIGWHDQDAMMGRSRRRSRWITSFIGSKTSAQILTASSGQALEAGCFEFNRLTGLLKLAKEKHTGNQSLIAQIRAAADEGMISLLNQIALIEESPESQSAIMKQANSQIEKLREIADRFEETLGQPTTLTDRLTSTTIIDGLLEQMRHESHARTELDELSANDHS